MHHQKMYLLLVLLGILVLFHLLLPQAFTITNVVLTIVAVLVMMVNRTKINFMILIAVSLIYGFGLTLYSQMEQIFNEGQYLFMASHLLMTATLVVLWLLIHYARTVADEVNAMQAKIALLEKYEDGGRALSYQEFVERGTSVEVAMKRRREEGRLILFRMHPSVPEQTVKSLRTAFVDICLDSVRDDFDLVHARSDREVLVLLQNTDEQGVDVVNNRVKARMHHHLNFRDLPYSFEVFSIGSLMAALDSISEKEGA